MDFQKNSGFMPRPIPIFTDAVEFAAPIAPNPEMEWKFNDDLIIPLTAFDKDADIRHCTQGVYFGKHESGLVQVRIPVQTTWSVSQALYLLDPSTVINLSAYSRAGVEIRIQSE